MSVSESQRRDIFVSFERAHGKEVANKIMQLLPHQSYDQLATRADLESSTRLLRGEMAELRAGIQGEMAELRAGLQGEMAELRAGIQGEMAELRADVRTEIAGLQRWGAGIVAANAVAVVTALLV